MNNTNGSLSSWYFGDGVNARISPRTTCGASVAAGGSCNISVSFTPSAGGIRIASVTIADNATGSPHTIALSGTGAAPVVTLGASSLTFANQNVGIASVPKIVTLSNTGNGSLSIASIALTGTNAADFTLTTTCGAVVLAGGSCSISVRFTPPAAGSRSASVTITDNAAGSPHTISLSGSGLAANAAGISNLYAAAWNGFNGTTFRADVLGVYQQTSGTNYEMLLRFDGVSLPAGSQVTSATLKITLSAWIGGPRLLGYYVQSAWDVNSNKLGWANKSDTGQWIAPGALSDVVAGKSFNTGAVTAAGDQTITITLDAATVNAAAASGSELSAGGRNHGSHHQRLPHPVPSSPNGLCWSSPPPLIAQLHRDRMTCTVSAKPFARDDLKILSMDCDCASSVRMPNSFSAAAFSNTIFSFLSNMTTASSSPETASVRIA